MTRRRYIASKEGKWIPEEEFIAERTKNAAPHVITDSMQPVRCMADHKVYDSKSQYNRAVKAAGCVVIGNETTPRKQWEPDSKGIRNAIGRAMQDHWK